MARIFKRRRGRDTEQTKSRIWHLEFKDHLEIVHRLAGFTDQTATAALGNKVEKLVALRMAGENPDRELTKWLEECPKAIVDKLGKWGILPKERVLAGMGLNEHLEEWEKALIAKGTDDDWASILHTRVLKVFEACKFKSWSDINALDIQYRLCNWRDEGVIKAQTNNHYVQHIQQFCKWMVDNGRATISPVRLLTKVAVTSGKRKIRRRALTNEEFTLFVNAALANQKSFRGLDGFTRATMYVTVRRSGLRWSELASLERSAFVLTGRSPAVYIKDDDEKHPRGLPLPLKADAVAMLKKYFEAYPGEPMDRAFPMPARNDGAEIVRHDLELAGIQFRNAAGEVFDFHAIRGQLATDMARAGIPIQQTQKAMRHRDINLTTRYYIHLTLEDQQSALEQLPSMNIDEGILVKPTTLPTKKAKK